MRGFEIWVMNTAMDLPQSVNGALLGIGWKERKSESAPLKAASRGDIVRSNVDYWGVAGSSRGDKEKVVSDSSAIQ